MGLMNINKPVILLTNDDGILSPGIIAAAEQLADMGELWVAAPHVQQTSMGRSFPPGSNGIIKKAVGFPEGVKAYSIEGSPAQCVSHAVLELMPCKPDILVSGINSGVNVGINITRSGTVGAALEAANYGIPALAVSLEIHEDEVFAAVPKADFSTAAWFTRLFTEAVLKGDYVDDIDVLKIDVPDNAHPDTEWEITKLSKKTYYQISKPERASFDVPGYLRWITEQDHSCFQEGTDAHAVFVKRRVSVTPVSLDMTSRVSTEKLQSTLRDKIEHNKGSVKLTAVPKS
jgi:5'-nucleotidase